MKQTHKFNDYLHLKPFVYEMQTKKKSKEMMLSIPYYHKAISKATVYFLT